VGDIIGPCASKKLAACGIAKKSAQVADMKGVDKLSKPKMKKAAFRLPHSKA
jgi:hypothetical protein